MNAVAEIVSGEATVRGRRKWLLIGSLGVVFFVLLALSLLDRFWSFR